MKSIRRKNKFRATCEDTLTVLGLAVIMYGAFMLFYVFAPMSAGW
jgi:hypothetical protein